MLTPDIPMAESFLHILDPEGEFTFQVFPESKDSTTRPKVLHGTLAEYADALVEANKQGSGIFVMVNKGDGITHEGVKSCRTAANVVSVRAVFVDLDGAPLGPVLDFGLLPTMVVSSSPDRWHAYWLISDCPLETFGPTQQRLAAMFNGDPSVSDLPRVMRLPGFYHLKGEPFMSTIDYFEE